MRQLIVLISLCLLLWSDSGVTGIRVQLNNARSKNKGQLSGGIGVVELAGSGKGDTKKPETKTDSKKTETKKTIQPIKISTTMSEFALKNNKDTFEAMITEAKSQLSKKYKCDKDLNLDAAEYTVAMTELVKAMTYFGDSQSVSALIIEAATMIKDKKITKEECTTLEPFINEAKKLIETTSTGKKEEKKSGKDTITKKKDDKKEGILLEETVQLWDEFVAWFGEVQATVAGLFAADDQHPQPQPEVQQVNQNIRPIKVGLEDELQFLTFAENNVPTKLVLNEHRHFVTKTQANAPGFNIPIITWGIDLPRNNIAISEVVTGPLSIGVDDNSADAAQFKRLVKSFQHFVTAANGALRVGANNAVSLQTVSDTYNQAITNLNQANMNEFKFQDNVEVPDVGYVWKGYRGGNVAANSGNLQVNYDIPLAAVASIKLGGHTPAVPTHFVDFFPPSPNDANGAYSNLYQQQLVAVQTVAHATVDGLSQHGQPLNGVDAQILRDLKGAFVLYIMEAISKARVDCLNRVDAVAAKILMDELNGLRQPYDWGNYNVEAIVRSRAGGAPKQERVQLIKTCVNDVMRTFPEDTVLRHLRTWWGADGKADTLKAALENQIVIGVQKKIRRTADQCPAWLEAINDGQDVRPDADAPGYEAAADTYFWNEIRRWLDTYGKLMFKSKADWSARYQDETNDQFGTAINNQIPGAEWSCITGTRYDSTVRPFRVLDNKRAVLMESRRRAMPFVTKLQPGSTDQEIGEALTAIRTVASS